MAAKLSRWRQRAHMIMMWPVAFVVATVVALIVGAGGTVAIISGAFFAGAMQLASVGNHETARRVPVWRQRMAVLVGVLTFAGIAYLAHEFGW